MIPGEYRHKWHTAKTRFFGLHISLTECDTEEKQPDGGTEVMIAWRAARTELAANHSLYHHRVVVYNIIVQSLQGSMKLTIT